MLDEALKKVAVVLESDGSAVQRASPAPVAEREVKPIARLTTDTLAPITEISRRRRSSPTLLSFLLLVIVPTLLAGLYTALIASDRYVSEFRVAVKSIEPLKNAGFAGLLGLTGATTQSGNDSHAVVQYIESRQAIADLAKLLPITSIYSNDGVDWWSRLRPDAPIEDVVKYWNRVVDCYYENTTGTIVVRVSAFSPQQALEVASKLLGLAETLVNDMSVRLRNDSVGFAEMEVAKSEKRLLQVNDALRKLRDTEGVLDPRAAATSTMTLSASVKSELSKLNVELATQREYLSENAPTMQVIKGRIAAAQAELDRINATTTSASPASSDKSQKTLSTVIGTFAQIDNEKDFADKAYQSALASLESARAEAARQQLYLARIVNPGLPEKAEYPRPFVNTAFVAAIAAVLWLLGLLGINAVKEHM